MKLPQIMLAASFACCSAFVGSASAQSTPGADWGASWGFRTANDTSVGLARANAIRSAELGPAKTEITYNNHYATDNRSNYVDINTQGAVTSDFHIGDAIDQNTNAVGSMNTGNTTIDIEGSGNSIVAENSASNDGCIDGSVLNNSTMTNEGATFAGTPGAVASLGIVPGLSALGAFPSISGLECNR